MIEQLKQDVGRLRSGWSLLTSALQVVPGALLILGNIRRVRAGVDYDAGVFVPLGRDADHPVLTSTAWDGDARSTTGKTLIDLSAVFGVPDGVKAVLLQVAVRDSASAGGDYWIMFGANDTPNAGVVFDCGGQPNDIYRRGTFPVSCNADGDIYYQSNASGTDTLDVVAQVWGYWL